MLPHEYNQILVKTRASSLVLRSTFVSTFTSSFTPIIGSTASVDATPSYEIKEGSIWFRHAYEARIVDDENLLMAVQAVYEMQLLLPADIENEACQEFADEYQHRQLLLQTRPYFRELLANMAPRALILALPLPTHFIVPPSPKELPVTSE